MKKVFLLLLCTFLLVGCSSKSDNLKSFKDYNSKKGTYQLKGTMSLISNEDEFIYDIDVAVKDNKYYKVMLTNTINNHVQVILKNDDGVYVVTPNLNKSFKFQSEWPSNSSQAYLIESLIKDINNDADSKITETKDGFTIEAKVNYPNNAKLDSEVITTDKNYNIKKVEVLNIDGNAILTVNVKDLNYNPSLKDTTFNLNELITIEKEKKESTKETCLSTCKENDTACAASCETENTSTTLDEIIYPLYVPTDTYLSSKDTVSTDNGNRVILTFAGTDPFILVEEVAVKTDEMEIVPVSGEPLLLGSTVGALTSNALYWTSNGIDYYLTSNTLDSSEMMTIAESITNSSSLVASTK